MDVAAWLRALGLEQYEPGFCANDVDGEVLPQLTADDLISIGVTSVGHRRKLLAAIAALGAEPPIVAQSAAASATSDATSPPIIDAERRQLTVMFCDIVGSTALSTQFDPEDLRDLISAYHHAIADTVGRFAGFVAKYMGDGVLIYFGYPQAHEDDAEQAVRAGLAVIRAVALLSGRVTLRVRIGIATGLAVVGDLIGVGASEERGVVGETPNLAARVQGLAEPNTIVIADGTRRQVGGLFELADLGSQSLAGFAEPQHAYRVIGESATASRFEALRSGTTPLVGRDEEIDLLFRRWAQAKTGEGRVVLLSGEPGIGKSRLTAALSEHVATAPHSRLRYFCSPHHQDSALYPFIAQLERAAGFTRDDGPEAKLDKFETLLSPASEIGDISLLVELLSLPGGERFPPLDLSPQRKKERTLAALLRQLEGLVRQQPVLMIFEDLHWIDPTSRELLDIVLARIDRLPVLLVATFRPEFQAPWTGQPHVTVISLNRLGRGDGAAMVQRLAGNAVLTPDVITEIVERTDGVPLFVEEMTKAVLEAGAERGRDIAVSVPSTGLGVPATLQASLMARLDRLGAAAKGVAQIGAAIGREFSYELSASVDNLSEERFQEALQRLVDAGLVFQRGAPPTAEYLFKHALVQDAAYGTLLRRTRQRLHARIAASLENLSPELMNTQPELFAQHYAEAGLVEKSIAYWGRAGHSSAARSAMAEAAAQLQKGLNQLALLPDTVERQRQELEFCSALGAALIAVKGFAAPETGQAYARARGLWEQLGSPTEFLRVPWGQWIYHVNRGDFDLGQRLAEDLLHRSQEHGKGSGLILARLCLGASLMVRGEFVLSRMHVGEADRLYAPGTHVALVQEAGVHPHTMGLTFLGFIHFCLGYTDQAVAYQTAAIAEARSEQHRPSIAQSLSMKVRLLCLLGDAELLAEPAEQLFAIGVDQGFPYWRAQGLIYGGWAKVAAGGWDDGISALREGIVAYEATGARCWMPQFHALQADAEVLGGHPDVALGILSEALRTSRERGENWFEAELLRRRGQLVQDRDPTAAETMFREAIGIAQRQEAKFWELRAAASLARLRRDQGRPTEARELLAPLYGWFSEGFDTPDLEEAKALLDELA